MFFFFKQKTAYEMRISDWSSDVCSSDLRLGPCAARRISPQRPARHRRLGDRDQRHARTTASGRDHAAARRLGGDPRGADRDRRHLRHEFRVHARTRLGLWLSVRAGPDLRRFGARLLALQTYRLALTPRARSLARGGGLWQGAPPADGDIWRGA